VLAGRGPLIRAAKERPWPCPDPKARLLLGHHSKKRLWTVLAGSFKGARKPIKRTYGISGSSFSDGQAGY